MATITKFYNCKILRNGEIIEEELCVQNGKIINPEPIFYEAKEKIDFYVDCRKAVIVPGFIDIQINGGYGYDFSSDISKITEAVTVLRQNILSAGVTSFCPTVVTSSPSDYQKILPQIKKSPGGEEGAEVLGIHLEGPFISPLKKGAHSIDCIKELNEGVESLLETYGANNLDHVIIVTLAPELKHSPEVIKYLVDRNIIVSLGHSNGNLKDGEEAVENGATLITHLFNAMLPFHHRDPGLVGLLTSQNISREIHFGIISDDIHTNPAAVRIAQRTHPKGFILVTDAMAALGLSEGTYQIGQLSVEVQGRFTYIRGTNTLAGSMAPMDECIRRFVRSTGSSLVQGAECASLHPAKALGIAGKKGTLEFGADADFVVLDGDDPENVRVLHTFIGGLCRYSKPGIEPLEVNTWQYRKAT